MSTSICPDCEAVLGADDNYCRRCGAALAGARLPAVRGPMSATLWQPRVPRVVKGAAVMAAGTVGQYLVRRALVNMLAGGKRRAARAVRTQDNDGMFDEAQIITETVMMRRVRIRRQA
ncbi:MAG: hypothetical protein KGK07_07110 [Chloroflexota bacterium]|nr:hypothetical protein [Chloroflexota bacterium]